MALSSIDLIAPLALLMALSDAAYGPLGERLCRVAAVKKLDNFLSARFLCCHLRCLVPATCACLYLFSWPCSRILAVISCHNAGPSSPHHTTTQGRRGLRYLCSSPILFSGYVQKSAFLEKLACIKSKFPDSGRLPFTFACDWDTCNTMRWIIQVIWCDAWCVW